MGSKSHPGEDDEGNRADSEFLKRNCSFASYSYIKGKAYQRAEDLREEGIRISEDTEDIPNTGVSSPSWRWSWAAVTCPQMSDKVPLA